MSPADITVVKKSGKKTEFDREKIIYAVQSARHRLGKQFNEEELDDIIDNVLKRLAAEGNQEVPVLDMHRHVEAALRDIDPECADQYKRIAITRST